MRQDIYNLFSKYDLPFQYHWNKIITPGINIFAETLEKLAIEL
jgi:hypothetical protein